eukprot:728829-Amorphochlora_amoeboformis.AAC.1
MYAKPLCCRFEYPTTIMFQLIRISGIVRIQTGNIGWTPRTARSASRNKGKTPRGTRAARGDPLVSDSLRSEKQASPTAA